MIKLKIYRPIFGGAGCPIWLEGKHWRLAFPTSRGFYFHFQKFDKNGEHGERMCYNIGFIRDWNHAPFKKFWLFRHYRFFQKFPADDFSPQCG